MAELEIKVETNAADFSQRLLRILKHLDEIYGDKEFEPPDVFDDLVKIKQDQVFCDGMVHVNLELTPLAVELIGLDVLREFEFPYLPDEGVN